MKRLLFALGIGVFIIASMLLLEQYMRGQVSEWAFEGITLSLSQRVMVETAFFWARFKLLLIPSILGGCLIVGMVSSLIWPEKSR